MKSNNWVQLPMTEALLGVISEIRQSLFDSVGKLALDKFAASPTLVFFNSGRVFLEDEIDSLNLRSLGSGIRLRL